MPARFTGNHEKAATNRESAFDRKLQQFRITGEINTSSLKQNEVKRKLTDDYDYHSMDSKSIGDHRISELERMAFTDPLTCIFNQRTMMNKLRAQVKRAHRYHQSLGVMMIEIDEFERISGESATFAMENLIRNVSGMLTKNIREVDFIGRIEGGKFMLVCPETSVGQICVMAERLRNLFAGSRLSSLGYNISLTVSIGVSSFPQTGENAADVFSAAEEALSMAQEKGGNFTSEPMSNKFAASALLSSFSPTSEFDSFSNAEDFSPITDEKEEKALLAAMDEISKDVNELKIPAIPQPVLRPAVTAIPVPEVKV